MEGLTTEEQGDWKLEEHVLICYLSSQNKSYNLTYIWPLIFDKLNC
jgi:hypothetical protein